MQAQENLAKQLKKIAARTHGQVPEVRTVYGKQLLMMKNTSAMLKLPSIIGTPAQDQDPASSTFGQWFSMVDLSEVDGSDPIKG